MKLDNKTYKTSGHLWQGRYKSFIVQRNNYFLTLLNYVEQNPQRAKLKQWKFVSSNSEINDFLDELPIELPKNWEEIKKEVLNKTEKVKIDNSIQRQSPYGDDDWIINTAQKYDITSTINPKGRPKKVIEDQ